jgi:NADH dehydrogenase FAD-containing subunit
MSEQTKGPSVVVLGGGYAGTLAALRVAGRVRGAGVRVTLVNAADTFVERIRLHQVAARQPLARHSLAGLLAGSGVEFLHGWVTGLEPATRRVAVETEAGPRAVAYDYLIYALGSTVDTTSVPGVADHAHSLASQAAAEALADALPAVAGRGGQVVVCGGGLTGIEAAAELAENYPRLCVRLLTAGSVGAGLSVKGAAHLRRVFEWLGVMLQERSQVLRVEAGRLVIADQPSLPFDLCLWAAGFAVAPLARTAGLAVNARGQVLVDAYLRSVSEPTIYAAGDAATAPADSGLALRMACATALPMGARAADNVAAAIVGAAQTPFDFDYAIQCISLGRRNGLIQVVNRDDSPRERTISGRLGAWIKEAICRYAFASLSLTRRWPGFYRWPGSARGTTTPVPRVQAALSEPRA